MLTSGIKFWVIGVVADAGADDGAVMGTAIGISDEVFSSAGEVASVATTTGGAIPGASRAGELPEGVAIEGKGEGVTRAGTRRLRWQGRIEERRMCARWKKRRELEDELR